MLASVKAPHVLQSEGRFLLVILSFVLHMPYNTKNITVQTRKATLASDNQTEEQAFITIWGIIKPFSVCIILV